MSVDLIHALSSAYDAVPYASHPFPQSTPENLEAIAFLFGLSAPLPANARVLELGCAAGGNLIPFAMRHPQAQVVGIDLSSVQIAQGRQAVADAGLGNITLMAMNLEQVDAQLGEFDYILCHGVYSWVPPSVQAAILRIASENLAPQGVAYISYNTYPGWKAREIVRDAMLLRGGERESPAEKLSYARGMVEFLHEMAREDSVLQKTLAETMPTIQNAQDHYLIHEFLEPCNAPCYLKDFVAAADQHGLAYLGDAEPSTMFVANYGEKVATPLLVECGGNQVVLEQYIDFIVNRQFRQTLLVKKERLPQIRYQLDHDRLRQLEYSAHFQGSTPLTLHGEPLLVKAWRGMELTLKTPVHMAVALTLNTHCPATLGVPALLAAVVQAVAQPLSVVEPLVLQMLNQLVVFGGIRYRRTPVRLPLAVSAQPRALALAQRVPELGASKPATACNAWHESLKVDLVQQSLLPLLDGQHGEAALLQHLLQEEEAKHLQFHHQGELVVGASAVEKVAREHLALALEGLRKSALLEA